MKTASSEPTHTTTVAPIQLPIPLMETPSVKTSVTSSAANVEIRATPPRRRCHDCGRRIVLARNGVMSATATVKTISEITNPVTSMSNPSRMSDATIRPTALPSRRSRFAR